MVQARVSETKETAEEALAVARASGNREAEGRALNALGTMIGVGGDPDAGVSMLRESLAIARELGSSWDEGGAWTNIADVLHLAGRTREALEVAREGFEAEAYPAWRTGDWLQLTIADCSFHLGEWDEAEAAIPAASRRHTGGTFLFWQLTRADAGARPGDLTLADDALGTLDHALEGTDRAAVRGAVRHAQRRARAPERRHRDGPRRRSTTRSTASSTAPTTCRGSRRCRPRACAWRATPPKLAHDRRDAEAERSRGSAPERLIERVRLAAASGGPVEEAQAATAEAE